MHIISCPLNKEQEIQMYPLTIIDLPYTIYDQIINYLNLHDILQLRLVSKHLWLLFAQTPLCQEFAQVALLSKRLDFTDQCYSKDLHRLVKVSPKRHNLCPYRLADSIKHGHYGLLHRLVKLTDPDTDPNGRIKLIKFVNTPLFFQLFPGSNLIYEIIKHQLGTDKLTKYLFSKDCEYVIDDDLLTKLLTTEPDYRVNICEPMVSIPIENDHYLKPRYILLAMTFNLAKDDFVEQCSKNVTYVRHLIDNTDTPNSVISKILMKALLRGSVSVLDLLFEDPRFAGTNLVSADLLITILLHTAQVRILSKNSTKLYASITWLLSKFKYDWQEVVTRYQYILYKLCKVEQDDQIVLETYLQTEALVVLDNLCKDRIDIFQITKKNYRWFLDKCEKLSAKQLVDLAIVTNDPVLLADSIPMIIAMTKPNRSSECSKSIKAIVFNSLKQLGCWAVNNKKKSWKMIAYKYLIKLCCRTDADVCLSQILEHALLSLDFDFLEIAIFHIRSFKVFDVLHSRFKFKIFEKENRLTIRNIMSHDDFVKLIALCKAKKITHRLATKALLKIITGVQVATDENSQGHIGTLDLLLQNGVKMQLRRSIDAKCVQLDHFDKLVESMLWFIDNGIEFKINESFLLSNMHRIDRMDWRRIKSFVENDPGETKGMF